MILVMTHIWPVARCGSRGCGCSCGRYLHRMYGLAGTTSSHAAGPVSQSSPGRSRAAEHVRSATLEISKVVFCAAQRNSEYQDLRRLDLFWRQKLRQRRTFLLLRHGGQHGHQGTSQSAVWRREPLESDVPWAFARAATANLSSSMSGCHSRAEPVAMTSMCKGALVMRRPLC